MRTHGDWHGRGSSGLADGSNRTRQFITRSPTRAPPPHQQQQQLVLARKREGDDGAACNKQQGMLNYWDLSKHELALSHLDVSPFLTPTDKLASAPADRLTDAMHSNRRGYLTDNKQRGRTIRALLQDKTRKASARRIVPATAQCITFEHRPMQSRWMVQYRHRQAASFKVSLRFFTTIGRTKYK